MKHFNNNLLCAVEIFTTGLTPEADDIFEICILPLDYQFIPSRRYPMFHQRVIPRFFDPATYDWKDKTKYNRCFFTRDKIGASFDSGIDYNNVSYLFEKWFEKLALGYNRKIMPVVFDAGHMIAFLRDMLGCETFGYAFHPYVRDILAASLLLNDRAAFFSENFPFQKNVLTYLASHVNLPGIEDGLRHDILMRTRMIGEVYKRITEFTHGLADSLSASSIPRSATNVPETVTETTQDLENIRGI